MSAVMNEVEINVVMLGCGVELEIVDQNELFPATTSSVSGKEIIRRGKVSGTISRSSKIFVRGEYRTLFETDEPKLFAAVREPLAELFAKLFAEISPMKCNMLMYTPWKIVHNFITGKKIISPVLKEIMEGDYTPAESALLVFLMHPDLSIGSNLDRAERKEIVASLVEYVESETFDTVEKINTVIQPWYSILGSDVEHHKLVSAMDLTFEQVKELKADPELLSIFTKFCAVRMDPMNDKALHTMSEVVFNSANYSYARGFDGEGAELFFEMPVYNQSFRELFMTMTVGEVQKIFKKFPKNLSDDVFVEWIKHQRTHLDEDAEFDERENAETLLTRTIFTNFGLDKQNSMDYALLIKDAARGKGYRDVATRFFPNNMGQFSNIGEFDRIHLQLIPKSENDWIVGDGSSDFILMKLCEDLGAVETVETIMRVADSDDRLTAAQWLGYPVNHELCKDMPVSWWGSLLSD